MAREKLRTLRSIARDDRNALEALRAHLPAPLRESLAPHRLASAHRTDQAISRIFEAAEKNRRTSGAPEIQGREDHDSFRS